MTKASDLKRSDVISVNGALLSTGLVVQVPEYIETGERIRVNTAERKYSSRA